MTSILDRTNSELNSVMTVVQNSPKCNANTSAIVETNLFNLNSIDRCQLRAITNKLSQEGILDAGETLEQWLSQMMPQITDGGNITVPELLAGLKQFLDLNKQNINNEQ